MLTNVTKSIQSETTYFYATQEHWTEVVGREDILIFS